MRLMDTLFTEHNLSVITAFVVGMSVAFTAIMIFLPQNDKLRTKLVVDSTVDVCTRVNNPAPKEWCDTTILMETYERNKRK